jgi:RNA polymerase sigma-70 factor (ECF subfamily)
MVPAQTRIEVAYREHYDSVRRVLRNRLDNEDDVAELAQETYLRVLRYSDHSSESLKHLLLRVAMNLAVSHRRQARLRDVPLDDFEPVDTGPTPEEVYERRERLQQASTKLASMSERCRKVFFLSRLDGVRHRDIARRYGISLRLVEKQITQAKGAIREQV